MPRYVISLWTDEDTESPASYDSTWTIHSFGRRHTNFKNPKEFFPPSLGLRRKLDVGTAFLLSYYEHSGCVWSLQDEGPQCEWDTVKTAGILLWEHPVKDMGAKSYEDRAKDARVFLEEYTAWANGWCYGYTIEREADDGELEEVDSCGGYIGSNNGCDFMLSEVASHIEPDAEVTFKGNADFLKSHFKGGTKKEAA